MSAVRSRIRELLVLALAVGGLLAAGGLASLGFERVASTSQQSVTDLKRAQRQQIDADTAAARAAPHSTENPNATPPRTTPRPVATGLIIGGAPAPVPASEFINVSLWQGFVGTDVAFVYTGADRRDPLQGKIVMLKIARDRRSSVGPATILAPVRSGPLAIAQVNGTKLLLVSPDDTRFVFDASSGVLVVQHLTSLSYTGALTADYHDPAELTAVLSDATAGVPVAGKPVTFSVGGESCAALTDSSGVARCTVTLTAAAGTIPLTATFEGEDTLAPATATASFVVTHEETTVTYAGDFLVMRGASATLAAILTEDGTTPIVGRALVFNLGSQFCVGVTEATGRASCSVVPDQPLGPISVTAVFAGDAYYRASRDARDGIEFDHAAGGSFVIGDLTPHVGTVVFWGSEWTQDNALSGGAPSAFKGYENSPPLPTCGSTWITSPANSSDPPATIPTYMAVLVASRVTTSGSALSGDVVAVVIVKTNGGYQGNVGHEGTGSVVATLCGR